MAILDLQASIFQNAGHGETPVLCLGIRTLRFPYSPVICLQESPDNERYQRSLVPCGARDWFQVWHHPQPICSHNAEHLQMMELQSSLADNSKRKGHQDGLDHSDAIGTGASELTPEFNNRSVSGILVAIIHGLL